VGVTMMCTRTGTAVTGPYTNLGTVTAKDDTGQTVTASNPDHYIGINPSIAIVKKTNGIDNDTPPGPTVAMGSPITWTYLITNTGDVTLSAVAVTDNKVGAIACPATTLAAGATMTCPATGTAVRRQYTNMGTVSAKAPN